MVDQSIKSKKMEVNTDSSPVVKNQTIPTNKSEKKESVSQKVKSPEDIVHQTLQKKVK